MTTYVLVANASEASLYTIENLRVDQLEPVNQFKHPESRQKWSDIVSDKRGRFQTDHAARCSYEDKNDPKDMEEETFARELIDELNALDIKTTDHESIILVAPPHFLGTLRKLTGDSFPEITDITKDYTQLTQDELLERIREHIYI